MSEHNERSQDVQGPIITDDLLEQANWGVGWVRVVDGGDRISENTMVYGSFVQAAFFAARLTAEGTTVTNICRWADER